MVVEPAFLCAPWLMAASLRCCSWTAIWQLTMVEALSGALDATAPAALEASAASLVLTLTADQ